MSASTVSSWNECILYEAEWLLLTRDLEWKWWKNIIAASSTEKHLLAAIKAKVLICQSLRANRISHPCPHLTSYRQAKPTRTASYRLCERPSFSTTLWCTLNHRGDFLTCKSGLRLNFQLTPSETWVGSRNTSLNLTWPDLEDFCVITALGRVDSHARREVEGGLPGAVMRADVGQQRAVPGAKERWR